MHDNTGARSKIKDEVKDHLLLKEMSQSYSKWIYHSEKFDSKVPSFENLSNGSRNNCLDDNGGPMDDGMHDLIKYIS